MVFNDKQRKWLFSVNMEDGAVELAGLIVGGVAPKWLSFAIGSLLWGVVERREVETELPSREDLRGLLQKLRDAAALIERELYSPGVRDFTGWSAFHFSVSDEDFHDALGSYVARIEAALCSPDLVAESGALNRGRGPARAPMRPTPEMVVALWSWRCGGIFGKRIRRRTGPRLRRLRKGSGCSPEAALASRRASL